MTSSTRRKAGQLTISGSAFLLIVITVIASLALSRDSNWFAKQDVPSEVIEWILLLRPFSTTEVDAVRKTLVAIESASDIEYRECFEPGTLINAPLKQSLRGCFSEVEAVLLESDGKTAVVHFAAVWRPSMGLSPNEMGYIDENIHVVKGLGYIQISEPIQFSVHIPGWFLADYETHLPFDPLTEVPLTSLPRLPGRLAVTSRDVKPRNIFERLGIGDRDGERTYMSVLTLEGVELAALDYEGSLEQKAPGKFPSWSPNGRQIAFLRKEDTNGDGRIDEDDGEQVFLMKPDGSDQTRLANLPNKKRAIVWSHDGTVLAFVAVEDEGNQVFIVNADGSRLQRIDVQLKERTYPTWSPVRKELAFSGADGNVYVFDLSDSQMTTLILPSGPYGSASWASTGEHLVVTRYPVQGAERLIIYDLEEHTYKIVEPSLPGRVRLPVWSPDGQRILFLTDHASYSDLWTINPDGSDLRRLTSGRLLSSAVWSPDGQSIALCKQYDSDGDGQFTYEDDVDVFILDANSGSWVRLAYPETLELGLSWTSTTMD